MKLREACIALSALAQESRLEVFRLLAKNSPDGLCAGDLSRALDIPKPTLSFHLKELSTAGLIDSEEKPDAPSSIGSKARGCLSSWRSSPKTAVRDGPNFAAQQSPAFLNKHHKKNYAYKNWN